MLILKALDISHFLEFLKSLEEGGFGVISPLYSTIVPRTLGIPNGSTGFKKLLQFQACDVDNSKCKCVPVEFPVFPHFSEDMSKDLHYPLHLRQLTPRACDNIYNNILSNYREFVLDFLNRDFHHYHLRLYMCIRPFRLLHS